MYGTNKSRSHNDVDGRDMELYLMWRQGAVQCSERWKKSWATRSDYTQTWTWTQCHAMPCHAKPCHTMPYHSVIIERHSSGCLIVSNWYPASLLFLSPHNLLFITCDPSSSRSTCSQYSVSQPVHVVLCCVVLCFLLCSFGKHAAISGKRCTMYKATVEMIWSF